MPLTAAQLEERRAYLGGTDAAALAGVNPPGWAQPIDVYLEKVGLTSAKPATPTMDVGSRLEATVADLFTAATGVGLRRWSRTVRSSEYPWAGGHLDRWAADGGVFEAKWSMRRDEWGPSHKVGEVSEQPRVPLRYAVQVQHYLAVTDRPHAYLAVLLGWGDFRWWLLNRNEDTIAWLMELEERFWRENVLAGIAPAPDGSEAYGRHLRRQLAADDASELVATPEQAALAEELRTRISTVKAAEQARDVVAQRLQLSMGSAAKLVGPGFHVSWATTKPRQVVKWFELASELAVALGPTDWPATKKAQLEYLRQVARTSGLLEEEPGSRPWKPVFDSDEEE